MIYLPKSQPAPACLAAEKMKANGNHNCGDVLERLRNDFKNKCYLCEEGYVTSINTEHFMPHRGNKDLQFNWDNLFFSCYHCNNIKGERGEFDNILNCTIKADGVDTKIRYVIDVWPKSKAKITAIENAPKVNNTVTLLNMVYNGTTTLKKIESENLRSKLVSEIGVFQALLDSYFIDDSYNLDQKNEIKNRIIDHLKPTSNFTAFKKWIVKDNEAINAEFKGYL